MKNQKHTHLPAGALAALVLLLIWSLIGCSSPPPKNYASDLAKGDHVTLRLTQAADGTYEVNGADVAVNDGEDDDGEEMDAEEDDGIECEQEGEHEGENEGCLQMVAGVVSMDKVASTAKVLWLDVQAAGKASQIDGTQSRFIGDYRGPAIFLATTVTATTKPTPRVMGTLQDVVTLKNGKLGLRIFDQTLPVHPRLKLRNFSSLGQTIQQDTDGDTEQDGIVCEQDGEHEGENEGC